MDASDWRAAIRPALRKRTVRKIMKAVYRYKHLDGEDGMQELEKFSQSFEQKTFAGATNLSDYLQQITSKEVSMKRKMQEEAYQKIVMLKEMYLPDMEKLYQEVLNKIQRVESHTQQADSHTSQKLKRVKTEYEREIAILKVSESDISPSLSKNLPVYQERIMDNVNAYKRKRDNACKRKRNNANAYRWGFWTADADSSGSSSSTTIAVIWN
ncbi:mediator of RNA polymerase II transcription subunit 15a [Neltuma alba]|uniref:mediator of RNA polymerase II transcription subunit 15a n=1 Tax=Neltuma alba TaxID=207710 RepID=UPI0010A52F90|nr:mediator of RNA polymerase II transcription subunit 15a-like [Prosopis alba]XP_028778552.1 mediator of RNA polymerase II transcription subunit 15a-like [Prosopis alba]